MYYFFFSYSRSDNSDYLLRFYSDLDESVRNKVGEAKVSYIDQSRNEPGDIWETNLEKALGSARVFLAVATASYVKKEYCGKEWAAFQDRLTTYSRREQLTAVPPLTIPILWIPPDDRIAPFPDAIKTRHFHVGNPDSVPNKRGVAYLTRLKELHRQEYEDLVDTLAQRIVTLAYDHSAIDRYQDVPRLADLTSPFTLSKSGADRASATDDKQSAGPKHVFFVYGAASPDEVKQAGRQALAAYGDNGGPEWQPFFPSERSIGALAPQVAVSDDIGMIPHELPLSLDLDQRVRTCEEKRQIVVILLDAWTALLPKYRDALRQLDKQNYINCSVLIPWNDNDTESPPARSQLTDAISSTLYYRFKAAANSSDSIFLRAHITDVRELRLELADVLIRLRAEIINHSLPVTTTLPSVGPRPTITGPGGQYD